MPESIPWTPYLETWFFIAAQWCLAGIASKPDPDRAWNDPAARVVRALWERMHDDPGPAGLWYGDSLVAFRLRRNTLRSILNPEWLTLKARYDAPARRSLAELQKQVNVFYHGKPFYDLTTKFVGTPRFDQLRAGTLRWEELDLPASLSTAMRDTFYFKMTGPVPYDGAVVVGYDDREEILIGLTKDKFIIELLKLSARFDIRGPEQGKGPAVFSPAERAQWLRGEHRTEVLDQIMKRIAPLIQTDDQRARNEEPFNPQPFYVNVQHKGDREPASEFQKQLEYVRSAVEQIHWSRKARASKPKDRP